MQTGLSNILNGRLVILTVGIASLSRIEIGSLERVGITSWSYKLVLAGMTNSSLDIVTSWSRDWFYIYIYNDFDLRHCDCLRVNLSFELLVNCLMVILSFELLAFSAHP